MMNRIFQCCGFLAFLAMPCLATADEVTYTDGGLDPFLGGTYTGTEDTMLVNNLGGSRDQNCGRAPIIEIGSAFPDHPTLDGRRHSLLRFDVRSLAGKYYKVNSVTLRLTAAIVTGSANIQAFQMSDANADWAEGVGLVSEFSEPDLGQSTWNQKSLGFDDWAGSPGASTAGVDYLTPVVASATFDESTTTIDLVFNDVSVLERWVAGDNPGLLLKTELAINGNRMLYHASESWSPPSRPQLIINYEPLVPVSIDIKPGDQTNAVNLDSQGVIPVAILSSSDFDATTVDPESILMAGANVAVVGKGNKALASFEDVNKDGLQDLLVKIETLNLEPGEFQDGIAILSGKTFAGVAVLGQDQVTIVPPQS